MTSPPGRDGRLRRRLVALSDSFHSKLWPLPAVGVLAAAVAGIGVPELERAITGELPPGLSAAIFGGGADAAREVLGAVATSLMTVTSLTFSLTVVTLQLASSQYTPRLLRTFASDRFVQWTLALFLATFVYSLTVLRTVRNSGDTGGAFVPRIAVTVSYTLASVSVLVLVAFLAHIVRQIRVETLFDHVRWEAAHHTFRALEPLDGDDTGGPALPAAPAASTAVTLDRSGFIVGIDEKALVAATAQVGAVLRIGTPVGADVVARTPIGCCWGVDGAGLADDAADRLHRCVNGAVTVAGERAAAEDIGYGLRQITDAVLRALSDGINDPTTAVHGLNAASALLCEISRYRLGPQLFCDDDGSVRVALARPGLSDLIEMVCTPVRRHGGQDPAVLARLVRLLGEVSYVCDLPDVQDTVHRYATRLRDHVVDQGFTADEEKLLVSLADEVLAGYGHPARRGPRADAGRH